MVYVERCLQCYSYYYETEPHEKDLCDHCRADIIPTNSSNEPRTNRQNVLQSVGRSDVSCQTDPQITEDTPRNNASAHCAITSICRPHSKCTAK